ncbi:unnamed protein product [Pylaiella littoralis]
MLLCVMRTRYELASLVQTNEFAHAHADRCRNSLAARAGSQIDDTHRLDQRGVVVHVVADPMELKHLTFRHPLREVPRLMMYGMMYAPYIIPYRTTRLLEEDACEHVVRHFVGRSHRRARPSA